MFSIFSDRRYLASPEASHAVIFAPFWGADLEPAGTPNEGRFARYAEVGPTYLRLTSLEDCDVGVFPQNWESAGEAAPELAERFSTVCREAGKPTAIFHGGDSVEPLPHDAFVFRTSLLRSQRRATEFALPAWSEDFLERYLDGEHRPRSRRGKPVVGFCGNTLGGAPVRPAGRGLRGAVARRRTGLTDHLEGERPRTLALKALERDRRIDENLVLLGEFMAGAGDDPAAQFAARHEYVRNMLDSDYILCVRGIGNFSYRLYETLSLGRIPVFVDTDCVLPLDFDVDWRDYCVWVDESEIDRIGDRILEFHESLDDSAFEERQHACRRLWETRISPQGFFASFHRHFQLP